MSDFDDYRLDLPEIPSTPEIRHIHTKRAKSQFMTSIITLIAQIIFYTSGAWLELGGIYHSFGQEFLESHGGRFPKNMTIDLLRKQLNWIRNI
ncbi:hypothetical protein ACFLQJ_00485 [Calditrichota bacterium]